MAAGSHGAKLPHDQRRVAAAECKGIAQQRPQGARTRAGGDIIQITLWVRLAVVNGGRQHPMVDGLDAADDLERGAGADGVAQRAFVGGDRHGIGLFAKDTLDGGRFNLVVPQRGCAMRVYGYRSGRDPSRIGSFINNGLQKPLLRVDLTPRNQGII